MDGAARPGIWPPARAPDRRPSLGGRMDVAARQRPLQQLQQQQQQQQRDVLPQENEVPTLAAIRRGRLRRQLARKRSLQQERQREQQQQPLQGDCAGSGSVCLRFVESELRLNFAGAVLISIIHKKPKEGRISADYGAGSIYTSYGPDEARFADLTKNFPTPLVMPAPGLSEEPIPGWWAIDFALASTVGTPAGEEQWIVSKIRPSCGRLQAPRDAGRPRAHGPGGDRARAEDHPAGARYPATR